MVAISMTIECHEFHGRCTPIQEFQKNSSKSSKEVCNLCVYFSQSKFCTTIFFYWTSILNASAIFMIIVVNFMDVAYQWKNPKKYLMGPLKKFTTYVSIFQIPTYSTTKKNFFLDFNFKYSSHFHSLLKKFATCVSIFLIPKYLTTNLSFLSNHCLKYSGHFHGHCGEIHERFTSMEKSQTFSNISPKEI